jgi:type I restriction enzyme S subunit
MSGWNTLRIKDLGRVVTGKTPPTEIKEFFEGEELFVSPKDLDWDQYYVHATETRVSEKALAKFKNQVLPANSIMFTCISFAFGKMGITSQPSLTNQQINAIVVSEEHDFRFVYYLLKAYKPTIFSYNSGIDTPIVPKSVFEGIEVVCPAKPTQQKIAAILSAYDDLIANNQRRITLLERMAEDIYREWFVRLRFPGHEQVKIEKSVPQGWRIVEIGTVCSTLKRGIAPNYTDNQTNLVINQRCIRDGFVDLAEARGHETKIPEEKLIRYGDVLINSTGVGTLGRVSVFDHEVTNATCDTHVTICRANPEAIDVHYLGHVIRSLQTHFENMAIGSTGQSELGRDAISRTTILQPPLKVQAAFAEVIAPMLRTKRLLRRQIGALATTRDTILPRLISGKLAVDALDIHFPPGMTPSGQK